MADDKIEWYERRVKALEGLLACYRVGGRPSEKLHRELELTGQRIGHDGQWVAETPNVLVPLPGARLCGGRVLALGVDPEVGRG
jgi:hypothetical protein